MDIDNLIMKCLNLGQIHISSYCGEYLCATLDMHNNELFRVFSNNGVNHLLMLLASKALGDELLLVEAINLYPHPLAPLSKERSNPLYLFAIAGSVSIFLTKDTVHLEQYVSTMQSLESKAQSSSRGALGSTFSEALDRIQKKEFEVVTCVPKNPMQ